MKKIICTIALVVFTLLSFSMMYKVSAEVSIPNYMRNGDFETDFDFGNETFARWPNDDSQINISFDDTTSYEESRSLKVEGIPNLSVSSFPPLQTAKET